MDGLATWLASLGLGDLYQRFQQNRIALRDVPLLTDTDLRELDIPLGPRRRILHASKALVDADPRNADNMGERRQVTVLFADMVGSTPLAARFDPEEMATILDAFQATCSAVAERHFGHISGRYGDGVSIYFGWPTAREDAAACAGRAAVAICREVSALQTLPGVTLAARVGAATGLVVVTEHLGPDGTRQGNVTGITPNLAQRLQTSARPGTVLVSETTVRLAGSALQTQRLAPQLLKGIPEPVVAHEVISAAEDWIRVPVHGGNPLRPLMGREEQLDSLWCQWKKAEQGKGCAVILRGEAGVGKSSVAAALADKIGDSASAITLHCSPYRMESAFWPLRRFIGRIAGLAPQDPPGMCIGKLSAVLPETVTEGVSTVALIARALGVEDPDRPWLHQWSAALERQRLRSAFADALDHLAGSHPLFLLVEDVHWSDPSTREFLVHLASRIKDRRALLLLTGRPDDTEGFTSFTELTLPGLPADVVRRLVVQSGGESLSDEQIAAIAERSDGIPLFVEELTRAAAEADDGAVPYSLKDTLMARLDRDRHAKKVAAAAAAIGRVFSLKVLSRVLTESDLPLGRALDTLVAADLVRPIEQDTDRYSFKHALVCDVALESLLKADRIALHARIFEVMTAPDMVTASRLQPEIVALHASEGERPSEAAQYWREAGDQAFRRSAHLEALGHYRKSLQQLQRTPPSEGRDEAELDLQLKIGVAAIQPMSHGSEDVRAAFARAVSLSETVQDPERRFRAMRGLWHWHSVHGDFHEARRLAEVLLGLAEEERSPPNLLMARRIMGYTWMTLGQYEEAKRLFMAALETYEPGEQANYVQAHGEDPGLWSYAYLAWVDEWLGNRDDALMWRDRGLAIARRMPNAYSLGFTLGLAAQLHRWRGEPEKALQYAREAVEISERNGVAQFSAWANILCGWAEASMGQVDEGLTRAEAGFAAWQQLGLFHVQWRHLIVLADIERIRGNLPQALARLEEAEARVKPGTIGLAVCEIAVVKGDILGRLGRVDEMHATLNAASHAASAQVMRTFELKAALHRVQNERRPQQRAVAIEQLAQVFGRFSQGLDTVDFRLAHKLLLGRAETCS